MTPISLIRYEKTESEFITKLPPGKHSTKGIGRTCPDPKENKVLENGLVVPAGRGVSAPVTHTSLLYNEYPWVFAWRRLRDMEAVCAGMAGGGGGGYPGLRA